MCTYQDCTRLLLLVRYDIFILEKIYIYIYIYRV